MPQHNFHGMEGGAGHPGIFSDGEGDSPFREWLDNNMTLVTIVLAVIVSWVSWQSAPSL